MPFALASVIRPGHWPTARACRRHRRRTRLRRGRALGFSLIEALVALALIAIVATMAAPELREWLWRTRLSSAARTVLSDLQLARSEALQGGRNVILRFSDDGAGATCYVLHTGPLNSCSCRMQAPPTCEGEAQAIRQTSWPAARGRASVRSNVPSMLFSGRQGTVSVAGSIDVAIEGIGTVRHVVSLTGRVRSCSPDRGTNLLPRCA
ncbi:GspH/FimT family pseudopilin [Roseateles chitosanitabidus]|uniref:GspH/FimT family pseudopilin n=1 Tax=Roseateles chitosanitabidus TaxID=65048 RepID=UPI00082B541C|nr:GspH/FimT family pseudopilin [Roseateles chitosanitabidus]MBO9689412.1 GspH/FimT family pseudopilin [Roseateles chitosanitabidus]